MRVVSLDELKRKHVLSTYAATGSNACLTARLLGISRTGIYRLLKRYGLEVEP